MPVLKDSRQFIAKNEEASGNASGCVLVENVAVPSWKKVVR
jgi:hypothetical protein